MAAGWVDRYFFAGGRPCGARGAEGLVGMRSASKWIERCLWTIGLFALSAWLTVWIGARVHQALGKRELDRRLAETSSENVPSPSAVLPSIPKLAKGDLIGRIEIPRLDLSTVIFEGTDDDVLRDGVGHLTGSPLPEDQDRKSTRLNSS